MESEKANEIAAAASEVAEAAANLSANEMERKKIIKSLKEEMAVQTTAATKALTELTQSNQERATLKDRLTSTSEELREAKKNLSEIQGLSETSSAKVQQLETALEKATNQLTLVKEGAETSSALLETELETSKSQRNVLEKELAFSKSLIVNLSTEVEDLRGKESERELEVVLAARERSVRGVKEEKEEKK